MFGLFHVCRWRVCLLFQTCIRPFSLPLSLSFFRCLFSCAFGPSVLVKSGFSFDHFLILYVYFRTKICFSFSSFASLLPTSFSYCACVRASVFPQCPEVRGRHFLCVDSLESSQLLISFSALLFWGDTPGDSKNIKSCTQLCVCTHAHTTRYLGKEVSFTQVCDICLPFLTFENITDTEKSRARCGSAVLIAVPYTWKSLQLQPPLLTIKTTCSKAAMLDLPPG